MGDELQESAWAATCTCIVQVSVGAIPPTTAAKGDAGSPPVFRSGNARCRRLQVLAREYFAAKPGSDNAGPNVALHNSLALILRGKTEFSESKMDDLFEAVTSKLGTMYEDHEENKEKRKAFLAEWNRVSIKQVGVS